MKMIIGMTPKRFKEKPNHEKMTSQPLPSFMFVHLVAPFLFSLWSLIFKDDPSGGRPYDRRRNETLSRKEYNQMNAKILG